LRLRGFKPTPRPRASGWTHNPERSKTQVPGSLEVARPLKIDKNGHLNLSDTTVRADNIIGRDNNKETVNIEYG